MKKLLAVILSALMLCSCLSVMASAATKDLVFESVEGTAVIDGVKDEAYDNALHLVLDQKSNGETFDEKVADAYIINDASNVYVFVNVYDSELDNTGTEVWEDDSVEIFWMAKNKQVQVRYHYDDSVSARPEENVESKAVLTDAGYDVEFIVPITDVKNNEIELSLSVNDCSNGVRNNTAFVTGHLGGDDSYQRSDRQSSYDCWWTLKLSGEHEDTRVDPAPIDESVYDWELTDENYEEITNVPFGFQVFTMDNVNYSWVAFGGYHFDTFGTTMTYTWTDMKDSFLITESTSAGWTKAPKFAMQVNDHEYLKLPEGADIGVTGDSAKYAFKYDEIVLKAEGYPDVIVPAGEYSGIWRVKNEGSYVSGTSFEIDFTEPIMTQLGLDIKGLCEYMLLVDQIDFTITMTEFNGITVEELLAYEEALTAADDAVMAEVKPYIDEIDTALASAKADNENIEAIEGYLATAKTAYDNALAKAGDNATALAEVEKAQRSVENIQKVLDNAIAVAEKAEADRIAAEEAAAREAEEAARKKTTATVIIIVIAVAAVVAVVAIILILKKKKK